MHEVFPERPASEVDFVAVDTETTGLRVTDRPVEVGAVRIARGLVAGTFQSLMDPQGPVPAEATAVHGITDADLAGAPAVADVLRRLADFGRGAIWLAHNAGYDAGILGMAYARAGLDGPTEPVIDTCRLARSCLPGRPNYRLEDLGRHLGLAQSGYHRALADADVAAGLFLRCLESMGPGVLLPEVVRRAGGWLTIDGVARAARHVPSGCEELQRAISEGLRVELCYDAGGRGRTSTLLVGPKVLFRSGDRAYLEAFCFEGRFVKSYRLDRVHGYTVLPPAQPRR